MPSWNTLAMFVVEPGVSFHSVQEVYAPRKWRISIQGWYHAATAPANVHLASIRQLTAGAKEQHQAILGTFSPINYDRTHEPVADTSATTPDDDDAAASDDSEYDNFDIAPSDMQYLQQWINPMYLEMSTIEMIQEKMLEQGSVQLMVCV